MNFLQTIRHLLFGSTPALSCDEGELRRLFAAQYKKFRALLTANNNALELMAALEQALQSGRPFGMAFVRGHCTALGVNVFRMVQSLQELSGGRYPRLQESFERITGELEAILERQPRTAGERLVLPLSEIDRGSADQVGEKMANLGEIRNRVGLPVPDGFVVTAAAALRFMREGRLQEEINRRLKTLDADDLEALHTTSAAIQKLIGAAPLPAELEAEITSHFLELARRHLGPATRVALRSSALGEDGAAVSFAGQYRTQLDVCEEFLLQTYREIVAGKYKSQAIVYRLQRGYRHQDVVMCVGCLVMVEAAAGGVVYSRPPGEPRSPWIVVSAAAGAAGQVVDGSGETATFLVHRDEKEPIRRQTQGPPGLDAVLSDRELRELARMAVRIEEHFGPPQDIEWALDQNGKIFVLQSRPLACLEPARERQAAPAPPADGPEPLLAGGITACPGAAWGQVRIVRSSLDLLSFPKGAVLVVEHPLPEYATLLPRAVAVVSETGQVAAHLATVAREFRIPAIFGLKGAASHLTDGREVTVDATACRIHDGKIEKLLDAPAMANLMAGSPIYRLLTEAMRLITPLSLTDPGSPFFTPSSCRSLHDITRFCHEKSVSEMFSFGQKHGFAEKGAKQLVGDTPFNWWVIDLDDGFRPGYDRASRYVHVGEILSTPMLAIWEGMNAIPWQGPPPVSLRGFGSILFESTMNRNLDPAVRSKLTDRNYFLVSKNFCNLSVRLGYHFTLVEAHLGELLTENYVSFQFKGGAADEARRRIRVELLDDILARFGFRTELKADALTARVEKKPADYLLERLRVLGYLIMHTRQIDMVLADPGMFENYREKILLDLRTVLGEVADHGEQAGTTPMNG